MRKDFIANEVPYNFNDVPTIKKFYLSNKRIRAITGPFGCFPEDCEYLSLSGGKYEWKAIRDYKEGEEIAVVDLDTKKLKFEIPKKYIVLPMEDDWVIVNNGRIRIKCSPEHVLPYITYKTGKVHVKTILEIITNGLGSGAFITSFSVDNDIQNACDSFIRLMVVLSVNGKCIGGNRWSLRTYGEKQFRRAETLLKNCGVRYDVNENVFTFELPETEYSILNSGLLPNSYFALSQELLNAVASECLRWTKTGKAGQKVHISKFRENADIIQFACHVSGMVALVSSDDKRYKVFISKRGVPATFLRRPRGTKKEVVFFSPPKREEKKYCFTTSTGFFLARYKGFVFVSGNSGKSSGCVVTLLRHTCEQMPDPYGVRRTRFVIIRNIYRQLKDTTKKTIDYWLRFAEWKESEFKYILRFKLPDNTIVESEWLLRALDRPEHIANLYSLEITGAWINEAKEISKEIFDTLEGRLRYPPTIRDEKGNVVYGPTWLGILLDTNPPDTDHWFYKYFEEERPEKAEIFHQPSGLSPEAENLRNLPENYYQNLCVGKDPDWIDVYVHGKYGSVKSGKPVFSLYNDEIHCAKEPLAPLPAFPLIIGMDFGLTPACVIVQKPPRRLLVLDEVVAEESIDVIEFLSYMVLPFLEEKEQYRSKPFVIIGDPAGKARSQLDGRTVFQAISQLGLRAYPAYTNSIQLRLNAVNQYLTRLDTFAGELRPAFLLSPTCKTLRQALKGKYKMKRISTGTEVYSDVPVKNQWSHVADALQYACLGYTPPSHQNMEEDFSFSSENAITTLGGGIY